MLRSNLIKLAIFISILAMPGFAKAKTLQFEDQTWEINPAKGQVTTKVSVRNDFDFKTLAQHSILGSTSLRSDHLLDPETASKINEIASKINQKAKDAKLTIEGKFAKEFEPGQDGQGLDMHMLRQALLADSQTIDLPVILSSPANKLSETNNLGIRELIAVGESDFSGSPANRIHNIKIGAEKFNGLIIDRGEEFSFNTYLGDVDGEHGFLPELVIKKSGVVPEFGGGLCQVSSTTFRAAMKAGMPITARRNHSFAVKYYAPQGTDATIYPGSQDLKFINDLPSAVLIRTRIDGGKLYFEYYGTKDNRIVRLEDPIQYDQKANGSLKATWTRHVTLNGETKTQTFNSTYQPPALFQQVQQASTPNPESVPESTNQPTT